MFAELLGALPSVFGALSGGSARRNAERQAMEMLNELQQGYDDEYNRMLESANLSLSSAAGVGGDAVSSFARSLGDRLASAGIYNSSATAGAIANQSGQLQSALASIASERAGAAQSFKNQGKRDVARMKFGLSQQQAQNARADEQDTMGALSSLFGGLNTLLGSKKKPEKTGTGSVFEEEAKAQSQLGVNNLHFGLPMMNGTVNKAAGLTGLSIPGAPSGGNWRGTFLDWPRFAGSNFFSPVIHGGRK